MKYLISLLLLVSVCQAQIEYVQLTDSTYMTKWIGDDGLLDFAYYSLPDSSCFGVGGVDSPYGNVPIWDKVYYPTPPGCAIDPGLYSSPTEEQLWRDVELAYLKLQVASIQTYAWRRTSPLIEEFNKAVKRYEDRK